MAMFLLNTLTVNITPPGSARTAKIEGLCILVAPKPQKKEKKRCSTEFSSHKAKYSHLYSVLFVIYASLV